MVAAGGGALRSSLVAAFQPTKGNAIMTVLAGKMLVEEIVPRLKMSIPKAVPHIGCDDHEELIQDATVIAAQMLSRVETQGKQFTAGNIAYYATLHIKSGRQEHRQQ